MVDFNPPRWYKETMMNDNTNPFDDFDLKVSCEEVYKPSAADLAEYEEYLSTLENNGWLLNQMVV